MNIIIPMAGNGQRFEDAGYTKPKPFIDVLGQPMIKRVIDNFSSKGDQITLICRNEHLKYFEALKGYNLNLIVLEEKTEGAVCTVLKSKHIINNDTSILIVNCDQLVQDFNLRDFVSKAKDASVAVFNSTNPHHSYVKMRDGKAVRMAEKEVISDNAVVGIYFYKKGSDFVKYAEQMISKNIRFNNEFYISPVFNELIGDGKELSIFEIDVHKKHMLGTPYELEIFVDKVNNGEVVL